MIRRLAAAAVAAALLLAGCGGAAEPPRIYKAHFARAFQLFPGVKVKVLGVDVGRVQDVRNVEGAVEVTFKVEDPEVKIPADVEAAIVPVSLLGERYVQLLPAYEGGPQLPEESTIPLQRTAVPAEADELLQAFQDYLGELDGEKVERFVSTAAKVVEGRGERLNDLIGSGTEVVQMLAAERDELAEMIVQFNRVTQTLSTRGRSLTRLIRTYNEVAGTVATLRTSFEGTITGLNDAAAALAALLTDNRPALDEDVEVLTRTTRTLDRNIRRFARTGRWAKRLFTAASHAVDYKRDWLRLSNQKEPLVEMALWRLQDRMVGLCLRLGLRNCEQQRYWQRAFPELFCVGLLPCPETGRRPEKSVEEGLRRLPRRLEFLLEKVRQRKCKKVESPERCRERKRAAQGADTSTLEDVVKGLVGTFGDELGGRR